MLCHLACQPILYILTLVATQESRGVGTCPAQGPALLPQELGCRVDVVVLSPSSSFLSCCGVRGSSDTSQERRRHPSPALQPELGFFVLLNEVKRFVCGIVFSPRGQSEHEDLCCTKIKLRKTHLLKYCIFFLISEHNSRKVRSNNLMRSAFLL